MAPPIDATSDHVDIETVTLEVIVLTQTCDLEQDKQTDVLVGRVVSCEAFVSTQLQGGNNFVRSSQFAKNLRNGAIPPLHVLRYHEGTPQLSWSLVAFRSCKPCHVTRWPDTSSSSPAAAPPIPLPRAPRPGVARFFMRVGLPLDVDDFERDGPAIAKEVEAGA